MVYIHASQGRVYGICGVTSKISYPLTNGKNMLIIKLVKKLFFFIQGLFTYPFLALPAFAQKITPVSANPCKTPDGKDIQGIAATLCALGEENIANTIRNIIVFFVVLAVIIALLYLLYGGIKWITSRGEKDQVEAARNHVIAAIVGLIVVFLAIFILSIVLAAFGIEFKELKIPRIGSTSP